MKKPSVETTASIASGSNSLVSGIGSDRGKQKKNPREPTNAKAKMRLAVMVGGLLVILCILIGILVGYSVFERAKRALHMDLPKTTCPVFTSGP